LNETGICSSFTAHLHFQQWRKAGVFEKLWANGLNEYDELKGIDWAWQSMDGAMTKAPLDGGETGPNPTDRAKDGVKRSLLCEGAGVPIGLAVFRSEPARHEAGCANPEEHSGGSSLAEPEGPSRALPG
jgi:hypothetical protein